MTITTKILAAPFSLAAIGGGAIYVLNVENKVVVEAPKSPTEIKNDWEVGQQAKLQREKPLDWGSPDSGKQKH